jgi:CRP-like cAMP-binding protein
MTWMSQASYPGAVLLTVNLVDGRPLRVLFGAPPEIARRLKADQVPGPDGKLTPNYPDVVVCPGARVVHNTPALCPEFILFAGAFLGGRYDWAGQRMTAPLRWVGSPEELADVTVVMKECFLGVDEKQLRSRVRSNKAVREMLLDDQRFFALAGKDGRYHDLAHYCATEPWGPDGAVTLAEGVQIRHLPAPGRFAATYQGETAQISLTYQGLAAPLWADRYPTRNEPLLPDQFGFTVLGSDSAFSNAGPTTTNLLGLGGAFFLWDCSPFTSWILDRLGISLDDIQGIFVSHIHDDHVVDLYRFAWNGHRLTELITTAEVREQVLRKFAALWGVTRRDVEEAFTWRLVRPGRAFQVNGASIRIHYGSHPIPSFGARFEYQGHVFGFTGDSSSRSGPVGLDTQLERGLISPERHAFLASFPSRQFTLVDAGEATIHGFVRDFMAFDPSGIALAHRSDVPAPFNQTLKLATPLFARTLVPGNPAALDAVAVGECLTLLGDRRSPWVNRLLSAATPQSFPAGTHLAELDGPQPGVHVVVAGSVAAHLPSGVVVTQERGALVGERSRLGLPGVPVRAVGPVRVLTLPGPLVDELLAAEVKGPGATARTRETLAAVLQGLWSRREAVAQALSGRQCPHAAEELAQRSVLLELAPGDAVPTPTRASHGVLVVCRGHLDIVPAPGPTLDPGDVVGDVDTRGRAGRKTVAVARGHAALLRVPRDVFQAVVVNTPALRLLLDEQLSRHGLRLRTRRDASA